MVGSLHMVSSTNKFSWGCKFADGVSIMANLQYDLFEKLNVSASFKLTVAGWLGWLYKLLHSRQTVGCNYLSMPKTRAGFAKKKKGTQWHNPESRVHGPNMGPTWVLSAPDGPHVGPMNLAIREWLEHNMLQFIKYSETHYYQNMEITYILTH